MPGDAAPSGTLEQLQAASGSFRHLVISSALKAFQAVSRLSQNFRRFCEYLHARGIVHRDSKPEVITENVTNIFKIAWDSSVFFGVLWDSLGFFGIL